MIKAPFFLSKNPIFFLGITTGFLLLNCVHTAPREEIPVSDEPRMMSPERNFGPDECISYFQPKKNEPYMCELADGKSRPLRPGETRSYTLSKEEIENVLRDNSGDFKSCEGSAPSQLQNNSGKLWVRFEIAPNGDVVQATPDLNRSTVKNKNILDCVQKKIEAWKFPVSKNDESVEVTYPFDFPLTQK